ncbi:DUF1206 domain-containing protein [Geodermatophilus chilensis]|uniref:DUF1206 domain-containing protein n=1 Tax=Geodermatophilus chilensis TaxID=2035835 RepID=UPI0013000093|nr:DUF1206 domain-containing protein [Geodermatophilus chilensis]
MATDAGPAEDAPLAHRAAHSTALRSAARVGLVGYALLHLVVAWLALQLAWRAGRSRPADGAAAVDQGGAMALLAESPVGPLLLWLLTAGLTGLGVWQAVEVLRHHRRLPAPGPDRRRAVVQLGKTLGTALVYGFLAVSAARVALGRGSDPAADTRAVRGVLAWPGGQVLVVAVGVVVVAIGVYHVRKGLRSDFLDEIDLSTVAPALCTVAHRASQAGFVLKGVAFVLVGMMVAWAAATFDPAHATGLDGALRAVAAEPHGAWVLTVVAVGLAAFAVYCLARARHPVG